MSAVLTRVSVSSARACKGIERTALGCVRKSGL